MFRVLCFVFYYAMENYVCIDYLGCQFKTISVICSDQIFAVMSYNQLLGIGIPEVLMNVVSFHGLIEYKN